MVWLLPPDYTGIFFKKKIVSMPLSLCRFCIYHNWTAWLSCKSWRPCRSLCRQSLLAQKGNPSLGRRPSWSDRWSHMYRNKSTNLRKNIVFFFFFHLRISGSPCCNRLPQNKRTFWWFHRQVRIPPGKAGPWRTPMWRQYHRIWPFWVSRIHLETYFAVTVQRFISTECLKMNVIFHWQFL